MTSFMISGLSPTNSSFNSAELFLVSLATRVFREISILMSSEMETVVGARGRGAGLWRDGWGWGEREG